MRIRMLSAMFFLACVLTTGCTTSKAPEPTAPVEQPATNMTPENFDKINIGMTYEDSVKTAGGEGKLVSESGTKGEPDFTVTYEYPVEGNANAKAKLTFRGNKLISKSKSGF
ncbi:hypothetical protein [Paenibacillus piri]|uniref:DUF3862 domain-containing protein n=1 Tax=Paenibacillus piri TaxID=2547395 RepID=A0A4V2ZT67_9BACL|nr:hypothetical protein [Paenibacillus piri]TDF95904.1 hypothetical protein E1757_19475 [Paenibacillus piri]